MNLAQIEKGVSLIIKGLGIEPNDPNFTDTPERYARFLCEMFTQKELHYATFPEAYDNFILFAGHEVWSLCPHHLLPVRFTVSLAYLPSKQVLGLSKLARVFSEVNCLPILQERFTKDVIEALYTNVPGIKGAACYVVGEHDCTKIRGVKSPGAFITFNTKGKLSEPDLERRFFDLVTHR